MQDAVRAVFSAKGRPADHPVIVHVADAGAIGDWAAEVPAAARELTAAFWPGPLTLVLKRDARVSDLITGGQDTVGLRSPAHPWARALLQRFGGAVAAPSANRFGRISPTTAQHVVDELGLKPAGVVDMVLDGGPCPVGIESTIVDLSGPQPLLLRPGAITREQLQAVLGLPVAAAHGAAPRAPGRLEKHYAPRTPLEVVPPAEIAQRVAIAATLDGRGARAGLGRAHRAEPRAAPRGRGRSVRLCAPAVRRAAASRCERRAAADRRRRHRDGPEWEAVTDRLTACLSGQRSMRSDALRGV